MNKYLATLFALLAAPWATAAVPLPSFGKDPAVAAFISEMTERHGFDATWLQRRFSRIGPDDRVLRAIQPAAVPEQQRSWERYRDRFVNERRIEAGNRFWQAHATALERASGIFGVPAEIIVAIIGVETEYGRNTGRFGVMQALSTLAFRYPPRSDFFRGELEQFLLLARENDIDPLQIKGSYAGAIGIPQFMPGSQRRYAVDFDGDGHIDLTRSADDAIGSVASFLALHGWLPGGDVASPAQASGDTSSLLASGLKPQRPLAELRAAGIAAAGSAGAPAALIDLVTPEKNTEYWVGFQNFYVITRYNRSSFYAMAVYQLAQAIAERRKNL